MASQSSAQTSALTSPRSSASVEGYISNLSEVEGNKFSFDVQQKRKCVKILSFTPQKKQCLEDKLKSPVKLTELREGKYGNLILSHQSNIEDAKVDFAFREPEQFHLGNSHLFAPSTLVNVTVNVKTAATQSH